jgi:cysteine-rich repeat protein
MKTRIILSLALLGACVTEADIETGTGTEHAQWGAGSVAHIPSPLFDQLGKPECGNGRIATPIAQQIEVRWLATSCSGSNEMLFNIQGIEVARETAGSACTCMPGIRSLRLTDPEVMKLIEGTVELEVRTPGLTLLAWAEVAILDQNGEHVITVFDKDGPSASSEAAENLCMAGSEEGGGGMVRVDFTGEQCDDGNLTDGDGCSSTCRFE